MNKDSNSKPNIDNMYENKYIKNLIKAFSNKDINIQLKAQNALLDIGKPAVKPLINSLRDEDRGIRYWSTSTLAKIRDKSVVELLIRDSRDENYRVRRSAAEALAMRGDKRVLEILLIQAREDKDYTIRSIIAEALAKMGDKRGVEILIQALEDEDPNSRGMAALILSRLGDKKAVEPLIKILRDDEDSYVRNEVVMALGDIGDKRAVEPLIKILGDDDSDIKCSAVCALGEIRDRRAMEPLIELLEDEDSTIRSFTISALGEIGDKRAVEPLIKLLKDEDKDVRCDAAFTLSALGDKRSVKPLRNFLKDEDSDIPHMILKAIRTFTLEDLEEKYRPHPSTLEESIKIEFKSSLRYDIRKNCINEELGKSIAKTIAAFLNTLGGTLYIGVLDDGSICGIENDINILGSPNRDAYKQALVQLIINYLGLLLNQYLSIDFEEWEGKTICRIDLDRSREPIYFKGEEGKEFFIRFGPTTRKLDKKETKNYIISRWSRRKLNDFNKSNS